MKLAIVLALFLSTVFAAEGVKVGEKVPVEKIVTTEGKEIDLTLSNKEYVLVFYRGSWCPYCMTQLKSIQSEVVPKLKTKQAVIGISVDRSAVAKKMKRKFDLGFHIVSDPKAELLKKFEIANKLDEKLVKKYKNSYSIDVEGDSGEKHHIVAHPAVFIVKSGKIKYADVHLNYKERTKNTEILENL
ncbi:MAG: hypothetical protein CME64_08545 [Halobacteriovoraceae bacterium]|nr:hypothetical protein [Halobacteriovoraceae bacterium]|tara:strand:- start:248464 stop:249024 length:561 start_codon:yes stop_codon:yes gene_type:complete